MDQRTLTALEGSIAKWQAIVDLTAADSGASNCPLCAEFLLGLAQTCHGCPVFEASGKQGCAGTPYELWRNAQREHHNFAPFALWTAHTVLLQGLAQAELAFLRSLRLL